MNRLRLENGGTDCFSNAALQVLHSLPDVKSFFVNKQYRVIDCVLYQPICEEISFLFQPQNSILSGRKLRKLIKDSSGKEYLDDGTQQDTVEFLEVLLEEVSKEMPKNNIAAKVLLKEFKGIERTERKFVNSSLGHCSRCRKPQRTHQEEFSSLKVAIPDSSQDHDLALSTLLDNHFSEDAATVKMRCSNCCNHSSNCPQTGICRLRDSVSQTSLQKAPEKLIVQLERFTYNGLKIKTKVWADNIICVNGKMYQLISSVDHLGDTMGFGHYVAHIRNGIHFTKYDDYKVEEVTESSAKTTNNYVFLYSLITNCTDTVDLTEDWQDVKNRMIPAGAHSMMDLASGKTFVRLVSQTCWESKKDKGKHERETAQRTNISEVQNLNRTNESDDWKQQKKKSGFSPPKKTTIGKDNSDSDINDNKLKSSETTIQSGVERKTLTEKENNMFHLSEDENVRCKNCQKLFKRLLMHLTRNVECQKNYDMIAMKEESLQNRKSKNAVYKQYERNKQRSDDPEKYARKRAAKKAQERQEKKDINSQEYARKMAAEKSHQRQEKKDMNSQEYARKMVAEKSRQRQEKKDINSQEYARKRAAEKSRERQEKKDMNSQEYAKKRAAEKSRERQEKKDINSQEYARKRAAEKSRERQEKKDMNSQEYAKKRAAEKSRERQEKKDINSQEYARKRAAEKSRERQEKKDKNSKEYARKRASEREKERKKKKVDDPISYSRNRASEKRRKRNKLITTEFGRRKLFFESVRKGPIYACVCCRRIRFRKGVDIYNESWIIDVEHKYPGLIDITVGSIPKKLQVKGEMFICHDCKRKLQKGKMPAMSNQNGLHMMNIEGMEELILTELENVLIARNILFQKFVQLPKSRWTATKDKIVNIPIFHEDILNTIKSFPRTLDEAGIIKVQLKRQQKMKGNHMERYVSTAKLRKALKTLKSLGNEYYQFVDEVECNEKTLHVIQQLSEDNIIRDIEDIEQEISLQEECEEHRVDTEQKQNIAEEEGTEEKEEEEYIANDSIRKWQFQYNYSTFFTSDYPELEVREDQQSDKTIQVAPGEGKIPTNILTEKDWDVKSFPGLHPDGKMGLHEPRSIKLTLQQYFEQRILNYDRRFANTAAYVFGAFACLEKNQLDRNINISFMRGTCKKTMSGENKYSLEDPYSVLDNSPGTPRYWQKKKYELIARLENLGPFQFFFTLSCADKRWNENFTTFLQDHDLKYTVKDGLEECEVDNLPLDDFLLQHEGKHEFIRKNILTATLNFNHRIQEFIKTIIMSNTSAVPIKYYNYRVEFQLRGAAHVHGTLWVDWEKFSKIESSTSDKLKEVFMKIKEETFGTGDCDDGLIELTNFVDKVITCSLKDPSTYNIVKEVQQHKHFSQSCYTRGSNCRFDYPKFPTLRTIIAIPSYIKYKEEEEKEQEIMKHNDEIKRKVKKVLENTKFMDEAILYRQSEIEDYLKCKSIIQRIDEYMEEKELKRKEDPPSIDEILLEDYNKEFKTENEYKEMLDYKLLELKEKKSKTLEKIPLEEIEAERLDLILQEASIGGDTFADRICKYEAALGLGSHGYTVWLKRDIDELYTNCYNAEYIKCWNGNMDIQVCLDYFAVITYISDYYMKDESGTMKFIKEALESNECETFKSKLNLVKNAFLSSRQIGECEVYYKMFPHLHLSHSNIQTIFIPTGFKKNRSRFLKQIDISKKKFFDDIIEVEGKEGKYYIEKENMIEKYVGRPKMLKNLCYSQFVKRYEPAKIVPKSYKFGDDIKEVVTDSDVKSENFIFTSTETLAKMVKLPKFIPIKHKSKKEEKQWMKRRSPYVLRFHKYKKISNPHEYYYSQMQLYLPFMDENDLHPNEFDKCQELYMKNLENIQEVKTMVMPHQKSVEEARERVGEIIRDVGVNLDSMKEQDNEECDNEGTTEHPDLCIHDQTGINDYDSPMTSTDTVYRKIELETDESIFAKIRSLDQDQHTVIDLCLSYAKDFVKSKKNRREKPVAPLIMVHGGAGTGKSHVIDTLAQITERVFRTPGDDPNSPYVLKTAFTGNAAFLIKGQTLHSAFNFPFSNEILSLSDKVRDLRRKLLHNLRLLIIDEISLVKSDMLYQLHFRLAKDIFQNNLPFGGISVVVFGDLLQIKPPKGSFIFEEPTTTKLHLFHALNNLWLKFKIINLKVNHRQGEDKEYAGLLNRIRFGEHNADDIELLRTRVLLRNSIDLPEDALYVAGTNKAVNKINKEKLKAQAGELVTIIATVQNETQGIFKPKLDNTGNVRGTNFQYELNLKRGCRIMMTTNLDVCDSLTNGTQGVLVDFKLNKSDEVEFILVKFDDELCGKEKRKKMNTEVLYQGQNVTQIEKCEVRFSLSKTKKGASSSATVTQFPLRLCYAATAHKIQGHTVKKPSNLIVDMETWMQPAMAYVMLSRIQCLDQLYIVGSVPEEKIKPWPSAMAEKDRLDSEDICKECVDQSGNILIVSLNTRSLRKHMDDIKNDRTLNKTDVICIQETWLEDRECFEMYKLPNKFCEFNNAGRGKGIATYFNEHFSHARNMNGITHQLTSITSEEMTIINLYISQNDGGSFLASLGLMIPNDEKTCILAGDWNFCEESDENISVKTFLAERNFSSLSKGKFKHGTHIEGRNIDQVYIRCSPEKLMMINIELKPCYYSDHDKLHVSYPT